MFNRTYISLFTVIAFIFAINSSESTKINGIPANCEPSIKSLEQELKICFYMQDKCSDLIGADIKSLGNKVDRWRQIAGRKALLAIDMLDKYNSCELEKDILLKQLDH